MDWKLFATVFASVFVAEIGDKTQLATFLYAADRDASKLTVFAGSSLALVLASAIGVLAGALVAERIPARALSIAAGLGFVAIGVWTIVRS